MSDARERAVVAFQAAFLAEGCSPPRFWGNGPGETYGRHDHGYHKVLFCLGGSIVFHLDDGDVALHPGSGSTWHPGRRTPPPSAPRAAQCVEASR